MGRLLTRVGGKAPLMLCKGLVDVSRGLLELDVVLGGAAGRPKPLSGQGWGF